MNILIAGAGGVGASMLTVLETRSFAGQVTIADVDPARAHAAIAALDDPSRFTARRTDARNAADLDAAIAASGAAIVVNACDPRLNDTIFAAARRNHVHYLDLALTPSAPHPTDPYRLVGATLGTGQLDQHADWAAHDLLALVGMGVEPGLSDVFARYAADHLFDTIDEIGVRDGSNLSIDGYDFAPTFSIWTTLEECLNPPLVWTADRGLTTTECFSDPEIFHFPAGIGPVECVNVEHEEVILIPRGVDCRTVTFKYGLGAEFIDWLKTFAYLGLDSTDKVRVGDVHVAPRDVLAAVLPDPARLGHLMHGATCAGTWVKGTSGGAPREVYLYHVADNDLTMHDWNTQAVLWQTAICPVVALELLASGTWAGTGVVGPEQFDAVPYLNLLAAYGTHHGMVEMGPGLWPNPKPAAATTWTRPVRRGNQPR